MINNREAKTKMLKMKFVIKFFVIIYNLAEIRTAEVVFKSEPVDITSAPWQVSVRLKAIDSEYYGDGHICGGSVISQRVVLSAAHCVVKDDEPDDINMEDKDTVNFRKPEDFTLVMGTELLTEISAFTLQYDVLQLAVHEAFDFPTLINNIAMFFIDGYIAWNWPTVRAIPLSIEAQPNGVLCSTSGWNISAGNPSPLLKTNLVPIVESRICSKFYGDLTSDLICAGFEEHQPHDFCEGDSGGPLVCLGHLTGIILEGNSCARSQYLGLYVNVLYHYNWIVAKNKTFDYNYYSDYEDEEDNEIEVKAPLDNGGTDFPLENEDNLSEEVLRTTNKTFSYYDDDDYFEKIITEYSKGERSSSKGVKIFGSGVMEIFI
ncbi:trypsin zeta, partial [Musca domestica]|uniref:Trypsin zeta n=1 Tax=Musca domestica TaxID=7370 RepID=A0A9J7D1D1_MUSDO